MPTGIFRTRNGPGILQDVLERDLDFHDDPPYGLQGVISDLMAYYDPVRSDRRYNLADVPDCTGRIQKGQSWDMRLFSGDPREGNLLGFIKVKYFDNTFDASVHPGRHGYHFSIYWTMLGDNRKKDEARCHSERDNYFNWICTTHDPRNVSGWRDRR